MFRLLLAFSFVFFVIAAVLAGPMSPSSPSQWYSRLLAAGLACWVLLELVTAFGVHL